MNIKDLLPAAKQMISGGKIALVDIANAVPQLSILTTPYPEAVGVTLSGATVKYVAKDDKLTLSGKGPWLDGSTVGYMLSIQNTPEGEVARAEITLPPENALNIPGLSWFQLKDTVISLESVPGEEGSSMGFKHILNCTLAFDQTNIPLEGEFNSEGGVTLNIGLEDISFDGLTDMAKIVGGTQNLSLPAQIDQLGAIGLHSLMLDLSLSTSSGNKLNLIEFGFGTSSAWQLLPNIFSMESVDVTARLHDPLGMNRSFSGNINGSLQLGGTEVNVTAEKKEETDPWTFKAEVPKISLSDLAESALNELSVDTSLPKIVFVDTELSVTPSKNSYSFQSQSASNSSWKIPLGVTTLDIKGLKLSAEKSEDSFEGFIEGNAEMFGAGIVLRADLSDQLKLSALISDLSLRSMVEDVIKEIDLPAEYLDLEFDEVSMSVTPATREFSINASSTDDWIIPLGFDGMVVEEIQFSYERKKAANKKFTTGGSFKGEASLGAVSFMLDYNFPGDLIFTTHIESLSLSPVIQDICGPDTIIALPLPDNVVNVSLQDITLTVSPTKKFMSLSSSSVFGSSELIITQTKQKKWAFMAAFAPPEQWRFSSIDSSLGVLDDLRFDNTALIISSAQDHKPPISIVKIPKSIHVVKGLTFFASLDMEGLGVDDLVNVQSLTVSTTIGTSLASMKLAAALGGTFQIQENIAMGDMNFFLRPAPSNFQLGISGAVLAEIDDSDLRFVGTMSIRPIERSAAFGATMLGTWNEPFGVKGLSVANLAMEVGIGIVPPPAVAAPIVGLAGTIGIGSFDGSAAVKFDAANPSKSMIAGSFSELYINDVIQTFCDPQVYNDIPEEIRNTVLNSGMEDVEVYVVPQATTIGELTYDPGFKFQGKLSIGDFDAQFFFVLDYSSGFAIKATMDPIYIEDIFSITGVAGSAGPLLDVDLRLGMDMHVQIEGMVNLLGMGAMVFVSISDSGFRFQIEGHLFDLFEARVIASGSNFKGGGDFYLLAEMKNDLLAYLREKAVEGITAAADGATESIRSAQQDIDDAQDEVNKLDRNIDSMRATIRKERKRDARNVKNAENAVDDAQNEVGKIQGQIESMRKTIRAERARDQRRVKNAENAVTNAQNEVNSLNNQIASMRNTIRSERARDTKRLRDAQSAVNSARNEVNSLQNQINSQKRKISRLKSDISAKQRWYNRSPWYKKSYRWAELSAYATAKGLEITACYTAIGGLEATKAGANGILEVAYQTLRGIEAAAKSFPIDADPRIIGLFALKETANLALEATKQTLAGLRALIANFPIDADVRIAGLFTAKESAEFVLEAAKLTLKGLQETIKAFPIDADARIVGLFAAKGTATATLQAANLFLEGVKAGIGGLADVGTFIVEKGLGGLVDVKRARFEGDLNVVKGGSVSMALDLVLMENDLSFALAFNFHNPLKAAEDLVQKLLDEIG